MEMATKDVCSKEDSVNTDPFETVLLIIKEEVKSEEKEDGEWVPSHFEKSLVPSNRSAGAKVVVLEEGEVASDNSLEWGQLGAADTQTEYEISNEYPSSEEDVIAEDYNFTQLSSSEDDYEQLARSGRSAQLEMLRLSLEKNTEALQSVNRKGYFSVVANEPSGSYISEKFSSRTTSSAKVSQNGYLIPHVRTHSDVGLFSCSLCSAEFSQKCYLDTHIITHTDENQLTCPLCFAEFIQKSDLNIHLRTHTGERYFSCSLCSDKFTKKCYLLEHMSTHADDKVFLCSLCSAKFNKKSDVNRHMRTHNSKRHVPCSLCPAKFFKQNQLDAHLLRKHTDKEPISCSLCSSKFKKKYLLNLHMRTHTGEKPFSCSLCSLRFAAKCNLQAHMRTHTGEKPFACKMCLDRFAAKCTLKRHAMKVHCEVPLHEAMGS
ncbi:gastrula zinc finger protein XlCGF57.1-like isoform X2 [Bacillus rossius redtenbacheri]|uniref:gastrula zinc finger protein XlCGF57.1-like isoform X2 n=1 Tax=Bacillus rossius redtenbacheri TaxID=93214 RepID=UPI002FDEF58C